MRRIELKELKELQCEVLKAAHDFCREHDLKYSLACGTLIGAIRHNGYIPWDDDIDIYMPRRDYDIFIKIFPEVFKDHYKLISYERSRKWCRPYANLFDDRTVYEEMKSSKEEQIGVNIDIFPVDSVPDDEEEWERFNKKRRMLIYLHSSKYVVLRRDHRSLWKNIGLVGLKLLLLPLSSRQIVGYVDSFIRKYNDKGTARLFECSCGMIQKHPFLKEDFSQTIPHKFEEYEFDVMKGYHDCLTNGFGDYMKLPPEKDRRSNHYYVAYWKD